MGRKPALPRPSQNGILRCRGWVAQWQSKRLIIARSLVQIQPQLPTLASRTGGQAVAWPLCRSGRTARRDPPTRRTPEPIGPRGGLTSAAVAPSANQRSEQWSGRLPRASGTLLGRILRRPLGPSTDRHTRRLRHTLNTRFMRNGIVMLVLVAATAALLYALITPAQANSHPYSQFYQDVTRGQVTAIEITDTNIKVTLQERQRSTPLSRICRQMVSSRRSRSGSPPAARESTRSAMSGSSRRTPAGWCFF